MRRVILPTLRRSAIRRHLQRPSSIFTTENRIYPATHYKTGAYDANPGILIALWFLPGDRFLPGG